MSSRTAKPVGRPPLYTLELAERICNLISCGETDGTIEKMAGMPSAQTIRRWRIDNPEFCNMYARARESRADFRSSRIDDYVRRVDSGDLKPDAARVMIDAEKWQASKEQPRVYGDRLELNGDLTMRVSDEQLESRLAHLIGKAGIAAASGGEGAAEEAP